MTTLINKLQEITNRLQHLTVWRPNERDPFFELDQWRTYAHTTIEQIYNRKRQLIEQIIEKHEREFMRQLTRQRTLLTNIRKRLLPQKEIHTSIRIQNEPSILIDLQKIENDINTKLGRGEILIETTPLNIEDSIIITLKTYLSSTTSIYFKDILTTNQSQKPKRQSADLLTHSYDNWLKIKKTEEISARKQLQSAKQIEHDNQEKRLIRQKKNEESYDKWLNTKKTEGAFNKKKLHINNHDSIQQTNET